MQELTAAETQQLMAESPVGHLAVIAEEGPYVSPMSHVMIDGDIYIRTGPGRRTEALQSEPRVCVEVSRFDLESGDWVSAIAWGRAEIIDDPHVEEEVVAALFTKYREQMGSPFAFSWVPPVSAQDAITVRIEVDMLTGRSSGKGLAPRTRPGRL